MTRGPSCRHERTRRVALCQGGASLVGDLHLYDVASETAELATSLGDALADFATGFSDDGRVSALRSAPVQAGLWSEADDWIDLESPFADAALLVGGSGDPFFGVPIAFV